MKPLDASIPMLLAFPALVLVRVRVLVLALVLLSVMVVNLALALVLPQQASIYDTLSCSTRFSKKRRRWIKS
jgi:hypothetical protein